MGSGEASGSEIDELTRDIERLQRRGEELTSELLIRVQPAVRSAKRAVDVAVQIEHVATSRWFIAAIATLVGIGGGAIVGKIIGKRRPSRWQRLLDDLR